MINKPIVHWDYKTFEELTTKELYSILQLRTEIFVVEQNCAYQECDGKDLLSNHLLGTINGELVAYSRLLPAGVSYKENSIGRVLIKENFRKFKIGSDLMNLSLEIIRNTFPKENIRIGAQTYLQNFYKNLGFKNASEVYMEDGIEHVEMLLNSKGNDEN